MWKQKIKYEDIVLWFDFKNWIPNDLELKELKKIYVSKVYGLLDELKINKKLNDLWNKLNLVQVFDENDKPIVKNGKYVVEFRDVFNNNKKDSRFEKVNVFSREVVFIVEDERWNILLPEKYEKKLNYFWKSLDFWEAYFDAISKKISKYNLKIKWNINLISKYSYLPKNQTKWKIISIYKVKLEKNLNLIPVSHHKLLSAIKNEEFNWHKNLSTKQSAYWYLKYLEKNYQIDISEFTKKIEKTWILKEL